MNTEVVIRYLKLLIYFAILWGGIWAWNNYSLRKVEGAEMEPSIMRDSFKWMNPKSHFPADLRRDDIISWDYVRMDKGQRTFSGRVVGLPGDKVQIIKGEVRVNGQAQRQDFVIPQSRTAEDYEEVIVPRDTVFVMCDNRKQFLVSDSRGIGPVGMWAIAGRF